MIDLTDCIALGTITKSHGIHGQVVLLLDQLSFNDIRKMELVYIVIDGLPVPFFISEFEEKTANTVILTFDDLVTEDLLKDLIDAQVFIPCSGLNTEKKVLQFDQHIIGYIVKDKILGTLGIVTEILFIEQNPLIKIVQRKKEILVPLQSDFILSIDKNKKKLYVRIPEGLIDLS